MAYPSEYYSIAKRELDRRREKATLSAQSQETELLSEIPELSQIKSRLAQIGFNISKVFFMNSDKKAEIEKLANESLELQKKRDELLEKHGYSSDALEVHYSCPHCSDTGFIGERLCKCQTELLKEIEKREIGKLAPLEECTFESFDVNYYPEESENGISPKLKAQKILDSCRSYAGSFTPDSKNIMFMGGTGLGKTHLSLAIANVAISRGYHAVYGTAQNILSDLEAERFGRTARNYSQSSVLDCDLLVFDDLGCEFTNQYSVSELYNIINSRILSRRATIISTNIGFDELSSKYDQRITSRISGEYSVLTLIGNDIRYIK